MAILSRAVSVDIKRVIVTRRTPRTYAELVKELFDVTSKLSQLAYEEKSRRQP
jgi:hypothetical protein